VLAASQAEDARESRLRRAVGIPRYPNIQPQGPRTTPPRQTKGGWEDQKILLLCQLSHYLRYRSERKYKYVYLRSEPLGVTLLLRLRRLCYDPVVTFI